VELIIIAIVLLSVLLNFFMEFQARHAVEAIRKEAATTATVFRDGHGRHVGLDRDNENSRLQNWSQGTSSGSMLGTLCPADARLLDVKDMHVRESALTGESLPVEKAADDLPAGKHGVADASNSVFLGTAVQTGIGAAVIVCTGKDTAFGEIAQRLAMRPLETEFDRGTRHFGLMITRVVMLLVLFVLLVNLVLPPSAPRVVPLLRRACRRDDTGDDANDHHDHTGPRHDTDDQEESSRPTACGH
jgi:Mg2+-importing ATPase